MQFLRANTQVKLVIGPVVAVGDGFTPVTTLSLGSADEAELMKHDASSVTDISGATFAAITSMDGYYNLTLTTSHTDTEGLLTVGINDDSLCLPVKATFMVLAEAAWDSMFVAKDDGFMDVNIKTIGRADTQETEASNLEAACAAYSATRGLSGTALPAAAADAPGGLIISDAGSLDADAQLVTKINDILTDTGTTLQGELDGIQTDTEDIQSRLPATLTADGNIKADTLRWGGTLVDSANVLIDGAITAAKIASDAITSAKVADGFLTAAKFASGAFDAVWSVATRLLTAGTNIVLAKGTGVTGFNDLSAAQVNAEADQALADYDGPTYAELRRFITILCRSDAATATDLFSLISEINADNGSGAGDFANTTEALEAIRDRGDSAWTTATGFSTLDAAGVRSAVGLASADLDIQLDALPTNSELATALASADDAVLAAIAALNNLSQANVRTALGLASANLDIQLDALPTAAENAAAILAAGDVDGYSLEETLKLCLAALAGKLSGAATTAIVIRAADDSKARITATVDADGNRSAVTLDETG